MFKRPIVVLCLLLLTASCGKVTSSPVPVRLTSTRAPPESSSVPTQAAFTTEAGVPGAPTVETTGEPSTLLQPYPPLPIPFLALAADPFDSRAVYALMANHELYRTIDGGKTWERLPFQPHSAHIDPKWENAFQQPDPGDLRLSYYQPRRIFLRAGGTLYAGEKGGENWLALIEDVRTWFVDDEGIRLYAWRDGKDPGLYRSIDGGQAWEFVYPAEARKASFLPEEVTSLVMGNISDAELFASTGGTVFRSPDGGESWREQPIEGLPAQPDGIHLFKARSYSADLYALVQTGEGTVLARFDHGWVSPDQDHWEILGEETGRLAAVTGPTAPGSPEVYTLLAVPRAPEQLYLGTASGVLYSPDGGESWEQYDLLQGKPVFRLALTQGFESMLYAGTESGVAVARLVENVASEPVLPAFQESVELELVAQVGGSLGPYVAAGDVLYAALGPNLVTIDPSEGLEVIWRSPILAAEIRALALDGDRLYAVTRDGQLDRYSINDPHHPELDASALVSPETSSLAVQGDLAAVVETRCRAYRCSARLRTLDISHPFEARVTGSFDLPGTTSGLHLEGSLIFAAYNDGLLVFDVSDGISTPKQLAEYHTSPVRQAAFAGAHAYLSLGSTLEVLDVSGVLDQTEPFEIIGVGEVHVEGERGPHFGISTFTLSGEMVYGFDTFGEFGHCWSGMSAIDVSDPTSPEILRSGEDLPSFTCAGQPQAMGEQLFVPDGDGLHVLDISDPLQPQPLGLLPTLQGSARLVPYRDGYLYWASMRADASLHLLDLRDPTAPNWYGPLAPGWTSGSDIFGKYLIAPAGFNGIQVVDLADPFQPQVAASIPADVIENPGHVTVGGSYAYVSVYGDHLVIVDLSDPLHPAIIGQYGPPSHLEPQVFMSEPAISGDYVYLVETQERDRQEYSWLSIIDVSDPTNPQKVTQADLPERTQRTALPVLAREMAYIPTEKGITAVDVSDPTEPRVAGSLDLPTGALDATFLDPYLLVAGGKAGLWIADISDPAHPVLVGRYDTPGSCSQVVAMDGGIYVNDGSAGVLLLEMR